MRFRVAADFTACNSFSRRIPSTEGAMLWITSTACVPARLSLMTRWLIASERARQRFTLTPCFFSKPAVSRRMYSSGVVVYSRSEPSCRARRSSAAALPTKKIKTTVKTSLTMAISMHARAAVHHQRLAGDEVAVGGGEESDRADEVFGSLHALQSAGRGGRLPVLDQRFAGVLLAQRA